MRTYCTFISKKICEVLKEKSLTRAALAEQANVVRQTVYKALDGKPVAMESAEKIAAALGIDIVNYLDLDRHIPIKRNVTITQADGTKKDVELSLHYDGNGTLTDIAAWGDEDDFEKALLEIYYKPVKIENLLTTDQQIIKKISGSNTREVVQAVQNEIKLTEAEGYHLAKIYRAVNERNEVLLLFKKSDER